MRISERWAGDCVLIDAAVASRYVQLGYWSTAETAGTLLRRNAEEHPHREAVVDDAGRRLDYQELWRLARSVATGLRTRGVAPGDVVGMQLPNRAEAAAISYGIELAGAVVCPLPPNFRERELEHIAQKCEMKALFTPGTYRAYDHDALAEHVSSITPSLVTIVSLSAEPSVRPAVSFDALVAEGTDDPEHGSPDEPVLLLFTSGTEAAPKGAIRTSNTELAKCRITSRVLGLGETDNVFMPSPIAHGTGYGYGLRLALWLGSKVVLLDRWEPQRALELIRDEACGYTHGSTPFVKGLLDAAGDDQDLPRFRYFVTGGMSVPTGLVQAVRERLCCDLLRLYGQTETGAVTVNRPWDEITRHENTEGRALPGVELAVLDDDGNEVSRGVVGEAAARSPLCCVGFVRDRERARAILTADGFMRTGDFVVQDDDGYLTFVSRKKEIISRGGYKYSPRDVEDVLESHATILRAAVVPMPDARLGERACLFVTVKPGTQLELEEVTAFLEESGVARFKWPERLEVVDELPLTPMGKVQKHVLGAWFLRALSPVDPGG